MSCLDQFFSRDPAEEAPGPAANMTNDGDNGTSSSHAQHTYDGALDALLHSPLHQARSKQALAQAGARRTRTIADMRTYMTRARIAVPTSLPVIHVTGTKGKGSTCCFCDSLLRAHGLRSGLFTSPHLVDIRERIRVGGQPVSRRVFASAYWTVRTRLEESQAAGSTTNDELPVLPGYFRMLTLMALFIFVHYDPPLDVIILEVGMGGRYDATNVLDVVEDNRLVVCGVTLLDLDHTRVLGDTLERIAWEKGGIFRKIKDDQCDDTCVQDTTPRPSDDNNDDERPAKKAKAQPSAYPLCFALDCNTRGVLDVLRECAAPQPLTLVGQLQQHRRVPPSAVLGLAGDHQRDNAELAVALCQAILEHRLNLKDKKNDNNQHGPNKCDDWITAGLARASWPGRCQTVTGATLKTKATGIPISLRLDGAHTPISLSAGWQWFRSVASTTSNIRRVLIFNCSHERNPVELLQLLVSSAENAEESNTASPFHRVFFCRSDVERPSAQAKATAQALLAAMNIPVREELLVACNGNTQNADQKPQSTWQDTLAVIWKHLVRVNVEKTNCHPPPVATNLTAKEALDQIMEQQQVGDEEVTCIEVLVIGSLYMVGSVLNAIQWSEEEDTGSLRM